MARRWLAHTPPRYVIRALRLCRYYCHVIFAMMLLADKDAILRSARRYALRY